MTQPFNAGQHPRAAGGLFAATAASKTDRPTGAWAAGPIRKGAGRKGAKDPRVVAMQRQLNALGYGDEHGSQLLADGIDGNHTTAALKKWQAAHGLPQTGEVDAKTMVALLTDTTHAKPTARSRMRSPSAHRRRSTAPTKPPPKTTAVSGSTQARGYADRGRGFGRLGGNAST